MVLAFATALCFVSGFFVVSAASPKRASRLRLPLRLSLSAGFGLGIFSVVFFVERCFRTKHLLAIDVATTLSLFVLYAWRRKRGASAIELPQEFDDLNLPGWLIRLTTVALGIGLIVALYSAILRTIVHSHGDGWDAFAIWNLHARFLFLGGPNWRDGFTTVIPWSHPDYPLLLPAAIAHFWTYLGIDHPAVPGITSLVFTISTLSVLYFSLNQIRGRNCATLATLALASTPFFVEQGSAQYADVPLSFFFLTTVGLCCLAYRQHYGSSGTLVLAGASAILAAWTKNEGLLFLFSALFVQFLLIVLSHLRARRSDSKHVPTEICGWKALAAFFLGILPVLLLILWFKHFIAPHGDLFSAPASMLDKLLAPSRAWNVLRWYVRQFFRFGHWWIAPGTVLLVVLYLAADRHPSHSVNRGISISRWTLALTLIGYFVIYLITPYDIYWHLRFSLSRLFLQIWPSVLFLFFTSVSLAPRQKHVKTDVKSVQLSDFV